MKSAKNHRLGQLLVQITRTLYYSGRIFFVLRPARFTARRLKFEHNTLEPFENCKCLTNIHRVTISCRHSDGNPPDAPGRTSADSSERSLESTRARRHKLEPRDRHETGRIVFTAFSDVFACTI